MTGNLVEWLESALLVAVGNARVETMRSALEVEREKAHRRMVAFDHLAGMLAEKGGLIFERARSATARSHQVVLWSPAKRALVADYSISDDVFDDDDAVWAELRSLASRTGEGR